MDRKFRRRSMVVGYLMVFLGGCDNPVTSPADGVAAQDDEGDPITDGCGEPVVVTDENAFTYAVGGMADCNDVQIWRFTVSYPAGAYLNVDLVGDGIVTLNSSGPQEAEFVTDGVSQVTNGFYLWNRGDGAPPSAEITLRLLLDAVNGDLKLSTKEAAY